MYVGGCMLHSYCEASWRAPCCQAPHRSRVESQHPSCYNRVAAAGRTATHVNTCQSDQSHHAAPLRNACMLLGAAAATRRRHAAALGQVRLHGAPALPAAYASAQAFKFTATQPQQPLQGAPKVSRGQAPGVTAGAGSLASLRSLQNESWVGPTALQGAAWARNASSGSMGAGRSRGPSEGAGRRPRRGTGSSETAAQARRAAMAA